MGMHRILLILPAYNEEGKIGGLVLKAKKSIVTDIAVCTDGCTDNTVEEARAAGAVVLNVPEKRGVGDAIRRGIEYALRENYNVCAIMGGDDQDDPQEIAGLVKKLDEGFDFVIGSRYIMGRKTVNQPFFRYATTKIYTIFFAIMARKKMTDASNGFRVFRTMICKEIDLWRPGLDKYELEPFFLYEAATRFRFAEAPVTKYYHTDKSYSKMRPLFDWWLIIKPVLKRFVSTVILRERPGARKLPQKESRPQ